ncbi:putative DNA-binding transcriptional regulator YafY [Nocardiopsis mwathae]|uniref:Putative DNA-binding transcriptional regulator YafY n=1 Tax=Nocardiopsis mwathae TaxID=1472723 RepID=A0A7W9YGF5_9ACTN|nr:putative DNA-binding transcriptional regulator YafY [Nocardiopsis mwathae]
MKADRLLSILLLLQTRGRVAASELAERLEVSPRTIYRDVEALSAAGVPVYAERGRNGGIALLPGFRTDVTGLTSDEARALFVLTAQGTHAALGLDGALGSALRKVMAALPAPHRPAAELTSRRILVDPDRWMSGPRTAVDLDTLHTAVFTDCRLRIRYRHSGATRPRTYTVDPYGLVAKAGVWYLVADEKSTPRLFRAERVAEAAVTDEPVRRRAGVELQQVWGELRSRVENRPQGVRVQARIRRSRLDLAVRILGSPPLVSPPAPGDTDADPDAWVPIELTYPVIGGVRQLLQFGASLEVLDPPEAREEVARGAAEISALYAEPTGEPGRAERRSQAPEQHEGPGQAGEGAR